MSHVSNGVHSRGESKKSSRRQVHSAASSISSASSNSRFSLADVTLDLGKLDDDFPERANGQPEAVSNTKMRLAPEISSEDEGPTDFTLNMETWMNGAQPAQKHTKTDDYNTAEPDKKGQDLLGDDSEFAPVGTSTPPQEKDRHAFVEDSEEDDRTGSSAPLMASQNTEANQNRAAEEVFSRITALQAEVERLRIEAEQHRAIVKNFDYQKAELESAKGDLQQELHEARSSAADQKVRVADLEETLRATRYKLDLEQARAADGWVAADRATRLAEELKRDKEAKDDVIANEQDRYYANDSNVASWQAKLEPLSHELASTKVEAEAAQDIASKEIAKLREELKLSQRDVARLTNGVEHEQEVARTKLGKIQSDLDEAQSKVTAQEVEMEARERSLNLSIEALKSEVHKAHESNADATVLRIELANTQDQISQTRRVLTTIEKEVEKLIVDQDREREDRTLRDKDLDNLQQQLRQKDEDLNKAQSINKNLQAAVDQIQVENAVEPVLSGNHDFELEAMRSQNEEELQRQKKRHEDEIKKLKSTILRAGEGMKKREERLLQSHREEITSLKDQIADLGKQASAIDRKPTVSFAADSPNKTTNAELRDAIRVLSHKLKASEKDLSLAQEQLATSRQEIGNVREASGQKMLHWLEQAQERFEAFQDKEKTLVEQKCAALHKEKDQMAKMLMILWGREECGLPKLGERQKYRYKYALPLGVEGKQKERILANRMALEEANQRRKIEGGIVDEPAEENTRLLVEVTSERLVDNGSLKDLTDISRNELLEEEASEGRLADKKHQLSVDEEKQPLASGRHRKASKRAHNAVSDRQRHLTMTKEVGAMLEDVKRPNPESESALPRVERTSSLEADNQLPQREKDVTRNVPAHSNTAKELGVSLENMKKRSKRYGAEPEAMLAARPHIQPLEANTELLAQATKQSLPERPKSLLPEMQKELLSNGRQRARADGLRNPSSEAAMKSLPRITTQPISDKEIDLMLSRGKKALSPEEEMPSEDDSKPFANIASDPLSDEDANLIFDRGKQPLVKNPRVSLEEEGKQLAAEAQVLFDSAKKPMPRRDDKLFQLPRKHNKLFQAADRKPTAEWETVTRRDAAMNPVAVSAMARVRELADRERDVVRKSRAEVAKNPLTEEGNQQFALLNEKTAGEREMMRVASRGPVRKEVLMRVAGQRLVDLEELYLCGKFNA